MRGSGPAAGLRPPWRRMSRRYRLLTAAVLQVSAMRPLRSRIVPAAAAVSGRVPRRRQPARRIALTGACRAARTRTRPPRRGTRITCLTLWVSSGAVVVANSTRRRISRSTTRISTIANVAPRQRRLPPPNGNHVVGLNVAPTIRSGSNWSASGYTSESLCTKPIPGTTITPAGSR